MMFNKVEQNYFLNKRLVQSILLIIHIESK